jgi:hypothetical protein
MKRCYLPLLLLWLLSEVVIAQPADIDINNVKARLNPAGDLFWNPDSTSWSPFFEVPKGSGKMTVFAANLWIGGLDQGGQLRLAGQNYRQTGDDFFQGPMMNPVYYSPAQDASWNKVWKINKSTIDSFRLGLFSSVPSAIALWPGTGNTTLGQASQLAPFVDQNGNGYYDPANGDYPCIRGDQAVFFLFNDDRNSHTETGGQKMGIEIHGMAYAFNNPTDIALHHTIFLHYKIINRSTNNYNNTYIGSWTDFDIGHYADDYIGSDVSRNMYYGYNGDADDEGSSGYGLNPPAQGVVFLGAPEADASDGIDNDRDCITDEPGERVGMVNFISYNNDFSVIGNPGLDPYNWFAPYNNRPFDYYNYMVGKWKDSTNVTYGGNGYGSLVQAHYMYPDSSDQQYGWGTGGSCASPSIQPLWSETTSPHDRRGVASCGPFTLASGEEICLDLAYVYARANSGGNLASVATLQQAVDQVQAYFDTNLNNCECVPTLLTVVEQKKTMKVFVYPNPSTGQFTFSMDDPLKQDCTLRVHDVLGREVEAIQLNPGTQEITFEVRAKGLYLLSLDMGGNLITQKIIVE